MTIVGLVAFAAGVFALALAAASLVRRRPSVATWLFFAGMLSLAAESVFTAFAVSTTSSDDARRWVTLVLCIKAVSPAIWLGFSLAYCRADGRTRLIKWAPALVVIAAVPIGLAVALQNGLFDVVSDDSLQGWHLVFGPAALVLNGIQLVVLVLTLLNLEQTFRSSVGTVRWRLKYAVLAFVVILGTRLYVHSQGLLFSSPDIGALWGLEAVALLIGCAFLGLAYVRTGAGWTDVTVYPSSAVVRSSLTVLIVGSYLLVVGVLAQFVGRLGGTAFFLLQTTVVLVALTGLAVLALSDRARQRVHAFAARHFGKAQHDSVQVWTSVSEQIGAVSTPAALAEAATRVVAHTFDVLSVSVWLSDDGGRLVLASSTNRPGSSARQRPVVAPAGIVTRLVRYDQPLDLDALDGAEADEFRELNPGQFLHGGRRVCIPLRTGDDVLGAIVLADRVNGIPYTNEDRELLRCMATQIGSVLRTLRLADEVARARELDAFRTMSTFFVHDLKNAAASLNLMLKNLPVHFDDPAFRADALRGIGNAARRIEETITRLTALRDRSGPDRIEADLNAVVAEAIDHVSASSGVTVMKSLEPVPPILADRDQLRSVITNLVMNAREAIGPDGRIEVQTSHQPGEVVLSVTDNGCGMSEAFVAGALFRPFQTTKTSGLGIGLFQTRAIVQAHGGRIRVDSAEGRGTTFVATFPVAGPR